MTSRTLTNVVNDQTMAFNAIMFGYGGHSLMTPHATLQQIWWTEERIDSTVTREYISSKLRPNERILLGKPLGFGDGLTDDTYMDWILQRSKRLFLTLVEIGVPDQIFGIIDDSWDDDDLPLPLEDVEKLALSYERNEDLNRRFYYTQFTYLLRLLSQGAHIDFASNEVLPLEYVNTLPPAAVLQSWSRVHLPKKPNDTLVRRKFSFGDGESFNALESEFIADIESAQSIQHEHIAPVWASYTYKGSGFTLTNFVGQHTLKSFIDQRKPAQYQKLAKRTRYTTLLGWLHCLADAVTTLHQNGFCHGAIRPSNILIDESNDVAFSDIGSLKAFQRDRKSDPIEIYNYGAPEIHNSALPFYLDPLYRPDSRARADSISSKGSSERSASSISQSQNAMKKLGRTNTNNSIAGFDFGFNKSKSTKKEAPPLPPATEKSDVFSLGCIYLDILTFLLKKKATDFVKHRSSKQKTSGSGRAVTARTDTSFHGNIDKVRSWMKTLDDIAFEMDDNAFRSIPHIMDLIHGMLSQNPGLRPDARVVRDRLFGILSNYSGMSDLHCGAHHHDVDAAPSSKSGSDAASTVASTLASLHTSNTFPINSASSQDSLRSSTATTLRGSSLTKSVLRDSTWTGTTLFDENAYNTYAPVATNEPFKIAVSPSMTLPPPPRVSMLEKFESQGIKRATPWSNRPLVRMP